MLKTLTDIITSLGLIDGKVSVMTADQLDEFARNIPDKKISCNVFGVGGYSRNDADVLTKTVRICLLKQMPVNYDLATVDLAESEMSTKLLAIMDALGDSPFVNAENQTQITPELLTYDRTTLLVYSDVDLFGNASDCGGSPCIPEFFNNYVTEKFAEINESVDAAEAAEVAAELAQSLAEDARDAASGYAASASDSADNAKASEDNALISAGNASDSAQESKDASEKAQQWSENPEDVEVEPGKYSALHHAAKAEESSHLSERWAEEEEDIPVDDGKYSAKHWAAKADETVTGKEETANKQNSLTVDGTGTKYPTVDAVNAGLTLKADSIDLVEAKQSISTLENTLSNANINQEARVTASGVDTVSLPKTAANTGMQVQLFGQSAQNLVANGDFRNGTTGYISYNASQSVVGGNLINTAGGRANYGESRRSEIFSIGSIFYLKSRFRVTNSNASSARIYAVGSEIQLIVTSPVANQWYEISDVGLHNSTDSQLYIRHVYPNEAITNGTVMEVDYAYAINLTATFGAGNEPTKGQCDILFANYFEGAGNVLGTGRIRSVNSSGLLPSYLYFNGGQIRSNGLIKDEIRRGANGYELVRRINPADGTVRTTPIITPIPHAGLLNSNSNGTAYFEPIIADAGVYSSNLAIQLTDYQIASFESIRKYANGTYTELNPATAVIASGGLSFTHPDLVSGDLVMFTYAYNRESIGRSMTLTHYDNRYVKVDTANGKTYRIDFIVTNGVVVPTATEV